MRLDRYLHDLGLGTRKEISKLIRAGRIVVNGEIAKDKGKRIDDKAVVSFDGQVLRYAKHLYLMMNKPEGVLTAVMDSRQQTVFDLLPQEFRQRQVRPVGRLDKDTTGLLLFTSDGELLHRLAHPSRAIDKCYQVGYEGTLPSDAVERVATGLSLNDGLTKPGRLEALVPGEAFLTISEGRHHQVKRMFSALGCRVFFCTAAAMGL